jgi:hypothetical protein
MQTKKVWIFRIALNHDFEDEKALRKAKRSDKEFGEGGFTEYIIPNNIPPEARQIYGLGLAFQDDICPNDVVTSVSLKSPPKAQ